MLKKSWLRISATSAVVLIAALLFALPVFARTITIDGNGADWVGSSIPAISDPDEVLILVNRMDVSQVLYTNNVTNLFFRIDTYASTTNWPVGFAFICLNTDNNLATGGSIDQCEDVGSQVGVDYVLRVIRVPPGAPITIGGFLYSCPNGAVVVTFDCTNITAGGNTAAASVGCTVSSLHVMGVLGAAKRQQGDRGQQGWPRGRDGGCTRVLPDLPGRSRPVSYTHLTLPTNREV